MRIEYYGGKRIFFQPLEANDESLIRRWVNDPGVWGLLARRLPVNELREREFIENLYKPQSDLALGIVVRDQDRLIGVAGLHKIDPASRSAVFGIFIGDKENQSRGYGTEAVRLMVRYGFRELNLNRIGLSVYADNERAIRAYRRAGFKQEGRCRQANYRDGAYRDELIFGILQEEWEEDGERKLDEQNAATEQEPESVPAWIPVCQ